VSLIDDAITRLRSSTPRRGVGFAALGGPLEDRWNQAWSELDMCIRSLAGSAPVLNEGGVYHGAWIESTGTINAELLSRFDPAVTTATHLLFAEHQREDGMIPYKVTDAGPAFSQIQIVTPLARSVWNHYLLTGERSYLETMYEAMCRYDDWLARYRDTRGTGGVEAFCTFDTGHDLSPRFWGVPERGYEADARKYDPAHPTLPWVAPDLTANVYCQRVYLARIADELQLASPWPALAAATLSALHEQCFAQGMFFDRLPDGSYNRIESDVLLRVLACEVGDAAYFTSSLEGSLMNSRKFFAAYGFTSLAMDDPRFDHDYTRNSWGGPSNFLSQIRAPHAFEHHGHVAELGLSAMPLLSAVAQSDRFPQCVDPWTGSPGFTTVYSPAILWLLDTVERHFGILPRPDGELWLSGLTPTRLDHGSAAPAVAYSRRVDGTLYELAGDDTEVAVWRDGQQWLRFPRGWRVVLREGEVDHVVGLAGTAVSGSILGVSLEVSPNERVSLDGSRTGPGFVAPRA
jgi:hypothetical protein